MVGETGLQRELDACLTARPYREVRFVTELTEAIQLGADGGLWDLVLVACADNLGPDGLGLESLRRLRRESGLAHTTIIAIVASLDDLQPAIAAGADDALTLPLHPALDLHITQALEQRGLRQAVDHYWIATAQEQDLDLSHLIFDAAPNALLLLDAKGVILTANPAAERLLQSQTSMLLGSPIGAFLDGLAASPDDEPRIERLLSRLAEPDARPVETLMHRINGQALPVEVAGRAVSRLGSPALVIALHDISHRTPSPTAANGTVETVAQQATAIRLLAQVSTELLAPLDEIVACADVIRREALGPLGVPLYHSYAADIQQSSQALLKLVDRLVEITNSMRPAT